MLDLRLSVYEATPKSTLSACMLPSANSCVRGDFSMLPQASERDSRSVPRRSGSLESPPHRTPTGPFDVRRRPAGGPAAPQGEEIPSQHEAEVLGTAIDERGRAESQHGNQHEQTPDESPEGDPANRMKLPQLRVGCADVGTARRFPHVPCVARLGRISRLTLSDGNDIRIRLALAICLHYAMQ